MKLLRIFLILVAVAFAGVAALVTFVVAVWVLPGFTPAPVWSASSGKPVPGDFLVVCYPARDVGGEGAVQLYDKADGAPVAGATLQRAVGSTVTEMTAAWTSVNIRGGEQQWVRTADLRYVPPAGGTVDYDAALAARQESVGFSSVAVRRERRADGVEMVRLDWRPDDDHVESYVYTVANNTVTPVEMYRYFGPGEVFNNMPLFLGVVAVAGVVGVIALAAGVWLVGRVTRRVTAAASR